MALLGFYLLADDTTNCKLRKEAIQQGYAEYNTQTGNWHWKATNYDALQFSYLNIKEQAVKLGLAQYNPQTGIWEWINKN